MIANPNAARIRIWLGRPQPEPALTFLVDGPLMTARERSNRVTERMAADLLRTNTVLNREDAVRMLRTAGYSIFDVHLLVDDARAVAFQEIVAKEMADG
jgi:hypothetical protein